MFRYESGDGTNAFQEGYLKPFPDDVTGEAVKGGFSYTVRTCSRYMVQLCQRVT